VLRLLAALGQGTRLSCRTFAANAVRLETMSELKLYGMRAQFDEVAGKGLARRDEIYPLIASLIRAERTQRQARSISYRIGGAKFPVLKDIDKFVFADTPVDEGQVRELATGTFLDAKRNAIFIGGTGTGKTHLCIAVASAVIRAGARGRFFNLVDLVNQLEQEKAAGRSGRLSEKLLRYDLIVIDELGYLPFSQSGGQLLFHLISKSARVRLDSTGTTLQAWSNAVLVTHRF
jgi:DNA replication protein DnaC